jgi:hypothetical protein
MYINIYIFKINIYPNEHVKQQHPMSFIQQLFLLNLNSQHHVQKLQHIHSFRLSSGFSLYLFIPREL